MECQKVKIQHKHPVGLLQAFPIPEWKWEVFMIFFITKFPIKTKQHDSITIVVDNLGSSFHQLRT
jgi:hypothetical protein